MCAWIDIKLKKENTDKTVLSCGFLQPIRDSCIPARSLATSTRPVWLQKASSSACPPATMRGIQPNPPPQISAFLQDRGKGRRSTSTAPKPVLDLPQNQHTPQLRASWVLPGMKASPKPPPAWLSLRYRQLVTGFRSRSIFSANPFTVYRVNKRRKKKNLRFGGFVFG